jgi:Secretion system C-terminal sorting domain
MKHFILGLAFAASAIAAVTANAGTLPEKVVGPGVASLPRTPYCQKFNRVFDADTCYVLTGLYYVEPGFDLTIQPGTVIHGHKATGGTLIITKGGTIHAAGTIARPIIFTSDQAPGSRNPGDWGGIIVLGNAPTNKVNPVIEGGLIGGSCGGGITTYGGPDANDNSGVLSFIRIEFAGYRFQLNNEVNGLTMGGVGAGTQIDHIQVSYSFDDSYEWFGGTVNCKYLVAFGGTDDEFDTDFGFTGHVQFGFALRDPDFWDPTGQSNGFESDNDGSSTSTDNPHTRPIFSNITMVGAERTNALVPFPAASTIQYSALLRRSTQTNIFNTVMMGYPWGISLRDATTQGFATGGQLQMRNTSIQARLIPNGANIHDSAAWAGIGAWFATVGWNNIQNATRLPDTILLNNMSNLNNPDPRLAAGSEAIGSADYSNADLAGFVVTSYRGAFPPTSVASKQQLWTAYWTNFDPQNAVYCDSTKTYTGVKDNPSYESQLGQNYPNPFNPQTSIDYTIATPGHVTLTVYDASGAKVRTLVDGVKQRGNYTANFNADGMASGVYFYRLKAAGVDEMKKMVLLK